MDLKQLEYFVRVAELGSFTRASSVLEIAQPALSRQVRLLETELRQNLLIRNGRGVVMTDAGKVLLEHARGILHQIIRAKEDLDLVRGAPSGRVAIGMPPSISKILTLPITTEFRKRMPEASLSISEGLSMITQDWLMTGRLDIALLYNPAYSQHLETVELFEEELYLISAYSNRLEGEELSIKEVAKLPLIIPARPNALRMLVETRMSEVHAQLKIAFEIDGISSILDLVAEGLGYAVLPKYAVNNVDQSQQFQAVPIKGLKSRLVIATAANRPTTLTQQNVVELIKTITLEKIYGAKTS
jgi:LysR family nitrogen assimilation transcriptional regulator